MRNLLSSIFVFAVWTTWSLQVAGYGTESCTCNVAFYTDSLCSTAPENIYQQVTQLGTCILTPNRTTSYTALQCSGTITVAWYPNDQTCSTSSTTTQGCVPLDPSLQASLEQLLFVPLSGYVATQSFGCSTTEITQCTTTVNYQQPSVSLTGENIYTPTCKAIFSVDSTISGPATFIVEGAQVIVAALLTINLDAVNITDANIFFGAGASITIVDTPFVSRKTMYIGDGWLYFVSSLTGSNSLNRKTNPTRPAAPAVSVGDFGMNAGVGGQPSAPRKTESPKPSPSPKLKKAKGSAATSLTSSSYLDYMRLTMCGSAANIILLESDAALELQTAQPNCVVSTDSSASNSVNQLQCSEGSIIAVTNVTSRILPSKILSLTNQELCTLAIFTQGKEAFTTTVLTYIPTTTNCGDPNNWVAIFPNCPKCKLTERTTTDGSGLCEVVVQGAKMNAALKVAINYWMILISMLTAFLVM